MVELIGAGWGRTGTLSLKTALEILGLPCYHMVDTIDHPDHSLLWLKAARGEAVEFEHMLQGYKATIDWPPAPFYKQLMEIYPDAKVIVTVRDPAKWYKSMYDTVYTIHKVLSQAPWYVRHFPAPKLGGPHFGEMIREVIWEGPTGLQGCFESDPDKAQQLFQQHIDEVKRVVPAERLLVFEVSQGWGPLCNFLGKSVPEQPFPHVNDTKEMKQRIAGLQRKMTMLTYTIPAAAAAVTAAVAAGTAAVLARRAKG